MSQSTGHFPMRQGSILLLALAMATAFGLANAQQLPKSGTISIHAGWKAIGEMNQIATDRVMGSGTIWGVTYNDKGSGPLHGGPAACTYVFHSANGAGPAKGQCYFSDPDGDKIFADFSGASTADGQTTGVNEITGGTGKYAGIQGKGPYQCRWVSAQGHLACMERFDYRLP